MRRFTLLAVAFLATCTPAGPRPEPVESAPAGPTLATGSLSREGERAAADLLSRARAALEQGRVADAEQALSGIVERYPSSRVSVEALVLRSRLRSREVLAAATVAGPDSTAVGEPVGDEARIDPLESRPLDEGLAPMMAARARLARQDLERLLTVLPPGDDRVGPTRLLLARVAAVQGEPGATLRAALSLPAETEVTPADESLVREAVLRADRAAVEGVLSRTDSIQPLAVPAFTAWARAQRMSGDEEGARRWALRALEAGAAGRDAEVATAVVEGRGLPRADDAPVPVGVVLPLGGSPAFQRFARELREGMEAALEAWGLDRDVELVVLDDGGDIRTAENLVRTAETRGAVAVLGLLEDETLAAAHRARVAIPLISPTAYRVPSTDRATLTLNGFDPGAAEALAEWAAAGGIAEVALIHAAAGASADEARLFREAFEARGGTVLGSFAYPPGVTFWEEQILAAAAVEPDALVLPVPPEDLAGLAPQLTFFGVDTLGIRLLGTGGWTDPQLLREVDHRHTDGVVAATPIRPGADDPGYRRFQEAYEQRFQRGLVDGSVQALGYDAASLVFQGIFAGAGDPGEVALALNRVQGLPGATGRLSVVDGRIRRAHELVCIENGSLPAIRPGRLPVQEYRPYEPDPETDSVPEGPGRPDGFRCPLPTDTFPPLDSLRLRVPGADTVPLDTLLILPDTAFHP